MQRDTLLASGGSHAPGQLSPVVKTRVGMRADLLHDAFNRFIVTGRMTPAARQEGVALTSTIRRCSDIDAARLAEASLPVGLTAPRSLRTRASDMLALRDQLRGTFAAGGAFDECAAGLGSRPE